MAQIKKLGRRKRQRREQEKKKRNMRLFKIIAIPAVLVCILTIVVFNLVKEDPIEKEMQEYQKLYRPFLPADIADRELGFNATFSDDIPELSKERIWEAMRLIVTLKNEPELSHPDDEEIISLIEGYLSGEKEFKLKNCEFDHFAKMPVGMMYNFILDEYCFNPRRKTTPILAISFYHEVMHAVMSIRAKAEGNFDSYLKEPQWMREYPCYGAEIRIAFAVKRLGLMPKKVGEDELKMFHFLGNVMNAMYNGYFHRFYDYCMETGMEGFLGSELDNVEFVFKE